jgi:hypothetical protein
VRREGAEPREGGADEARVVTAYLRRRSTAIEAVRLREAQDLLEAAKRLPGCAEEGAISLP